MEAFHTCGISMSSFKRCVGKATRDPSVEGHLRTAGFGESCAVLQSLSFVYTSAPLTYCAVCVWCISSAQLINFLQTWGEQRTPSAWKGHPSHPVFFVLRKKPTNFGSRRMVCEPFANGTAQVRSLIHTYTCLVHELFANHLAHSCIRGFL